MSSCSLFHRCNQTSQCRLKYCTAFSCFFAAAFVSNVPRFLRLPVFGFFFREYNRYLPFLSLRITPLPRSYVSLIAVRMRLKILCAKNCMPRVGGEYRRASKKTNGPTDVSTIFNYLDAGEGQ